LRLQPLGSVVHAQQVLALRFWISAAAQLDDAIAKITARTRVLKRVHRVRRLAFANDGKPTLAERGYAHRFRRGALGTHQVE